MLTSAKRWAAAVAALGLLVVAGCGAQTARPASGSYSVGMGRVPRACFAPGTGLFARPLPPPATRSAPPSATVLARYALFRRAARRGDAPPVRARALARALATDSQLASIDVADTRRLAATADSYAIPVVGLPTFVVPKRCPAELRRDTSPRRRRYTGGPAYCTFEVRRGGRVGGVHCEPFAAAASGAALFSGLRGEREVVLVPDGVATVRISYLKRAATVAAVHGNAVVVTLPAAPTQVALLDPAGRVVRTIDVFTAARSPRLERAPIYG